MKKKTSGRTTRTCCKESRHSMRNYKSLVKHFSKRIPVGNEEQVADGSSSLKWAACCVLLPIDTDRCKTFVDEEIRDTLRSFLLRMLTDGFVTALDFRAAKVAFQRRLSSKKEIKRKI